MAANPFEHAHPNSNLFDIYTDPTSAGRNALSMPVWPGGSCNFVDLASGGNGVRCGCRRFWVRPLSGPPTPDSTGWCMCNHHACFHDQGGLDAQVFDTRLPIGQENERPGSGREPLSPVPGLLQNPGSTDFGLEYANLGPNDSLSFIYYDPDALGISRTDAAAVNAQPPPGSMPDTLDWNQLVHTNTQAPSATQCDTPRPLPSQTASTASSHYLKSLRPFAGKGLDTLGRSRGPAPTSQQPRYSPRPTGLPQTHASALTSGQASHSRTEVPVEVYVSQAATQQEPRATEEGVTREILRNITDTMGAHEQRLDRLETVSFSVAGHEECHEKHDHTDLRVTDLEVRMEEVEKQAARFAEKNDDAASQSVASFSTAGTSRPTHSQELHSQLQLLQAQVNSLQSILPSHSHTWEVEVVFLPFGLKKIWLDPQDFKSSHEQDSDEWTQLHMTYSSGQRSSQPYRHDSWIGSQRDDRWLLPKAFAEDGVVDKRLRSRGMVRTVSVGGPDASSVQAAFRSAFGSTWREMQLDSASHTGSSCSSRFMGILSPWIPLRKIHKDSRLRFLSPAEMLNPTTWTVPFLNSVMMRSSKPRLFVTHPDAYLQESQSYDTAWSWKRLQGLTKSADVRQSDEQAWEFHAQFDEPSRVSSPIMKSERSHTSLSSSTSHRLQTDATKRSSSPAIQSNAQAYRPHSRRGSRPPHIRTASMPTSAHAQQSPALGRRVVSGGQSRRSSPSVRVAPHFAVTKRRQTRSPSYQRFTPRWTASPSPMPMAIDRQSAQPTTPFAYATPFSNAPLQEFPRVRGVSGGPALMDDDGDDGDELYDVEFNMNSDSDGTNSETGSTSSAEEVTHEHAQGTCDSQQWQFPEDRPWPGIEDQHQLSDGENVNPREVDGCSEASSQPSEYPSTQQAWPGAESTEFRIHEDDD